MKYITAAEAARRIGVSERTVRMWIKQKKLNAYHVEKNRLAIPEGEVSSMAAERSQYEQTYPDVSALLERIEALEQQQTALEKRIHTLETREKAERITLKEKAVSSPVKHDTDQHTTVSAPPGDTIASHTFAEQHGINKRTMGDYLAGRNQWNDRIESIVIGRSGPHQIHGLTPAQQHQAILFFQRHDVRYTPCPQCPHEPVQEQE